MKDSQKDLLIAGLVLVFALSTYVQLFWDNKAKAIQYEICLNRSLDRFEKSTNPFDRGELDLFDLMIENDCKQYQPRL